MDSLLLKFSQPKQYYAQHFENNIRLDGRGVGNNRDLVFERSVLSNECYGSSLVSLGHTKVSCGVMMHVGVPPIQYPNKGEIAIECTQGAVSYPLQAMMDKLKTSNKSEDMWVLEQQLLMVISESGSIDRESLCLVPVSAYSSFISNGDCQSRDWPLLRSLFICMSYAMMGEYSMPVSMQWEMRGGTQRGPHTSPVPMDQSPGRSISVRSPRPPLVSGNFC